MNDALVPVSGPLGDVVAVIVAAPVLAMVTLVLASTPELNVAVVMGAPTSVPLDVRTTAPLKPVAIFVKASCATTFTLNALFAT